MGVLESTGGDMKVSQPAVRRRTALERQPYLWAYGGVISVFSPAASLYQLLKLNPAAASQIPRGALLRLPVYTLPAQTILKASQMNVATPINEFANPWLAFGMVGVLQGGVYGQATIYFSKKLNIGKLPSYRGLFRGVPFAGLRDMISQGVPYVFSDVVQKEIVAPFFPDNGNELRGSVQRWSSILSTSIISCYMSQGLHNIQITMQAHQGLSHIDAVRKAVSENGFRLLYRGAEARVGLLLLVNILNQLLLKRAWEPIPL